MGLLILCLTQGPRGSKSSRTILALRLHNNCSMVNGPAKVLSFKRMPDSGIQ